MAKHRNLKFPRKYVFLVKYQNRDVLESIKNNKELRFVKIKIIIDDSSFLKFSLLCITRFKHNINIKKKSHATQGVPSEGKT